MVHEPLFTHIKFSRQASSAHSAQMLLSARLVVHCELRCALTPHGLTTSRASHSLHALHVVDAPLELGRGAKVGAANEHGLHGCAERGTESGASCDKVWCG